MTKHLFALLCLLALLVPARAQHTISGTIVDDRTGETLIGATVYDTLSHQGAATNQHGRYTLTLKGSQAVLRISYVGYETQFIPQQLAQDQRLNVRLKGSVTLQEVTITDHRTSHVEGSQVSRIEVPAEMVKAVPALFGENDLVKAIQLLPGVQSGSEGTSGLYVRGGGPDENLFLLDGIPMYNVNHLGGFFSAFNADAVKNISLYKGSFPAHFSSRLSSVLDITTNNGNEHEFHGGASIGLISAKLFVEGPIVKEKTTFCLSARRTYGDVLLQPIIAIALASQGGSDKITAGYYFYDLNAKITHCFSDRSRLYVSHYMGDDALYARVRTRYTNEGTYEKDYTNLGYYWGNIVSSVRWNYELSPKLFMNATGAFTRYRNNLSAGQEYTYADNSEEFSIHFNSGIQDVTARVDFDYAPSPDHAVRFGTQYINHRFTPETSSMEMHEDYGSDLFDFDTVIGQSRVFAHEICAYIEDDWRIGDRVKVNAGLNLTAFGVQDTLYPSLQPRLSGRWLITDNLSAKVGYARMTQYLHLLSNSSISLPTDLWVPVTKRIAPMTSNQVAGGLFYSVAGIADFSVEGYYKTMDNLLEYRDGASFMLNSAGWEDKVCMGEGWAYGIELLAQRNVGKLTGWLGYTWSHTNRLFDRPGQELNGGRMFPAKYDRRHDLSVVLNYKVSERFDFGLTWVFCSGNTATLGLQEFDPDASGNTYYYYYYGNSSATYIDSRNNYRLPNYHRMDVSMNWHKQLRRCKRTVNVSIYNVYNRQNPYIVYEGYNDMNRPALMQLSIFPILPSVSYSLTF